MKWNVRGGAAVVCQPVTVCLRVCVCVLSYLLHTESQNTYSISKVRTFFGVGFKCGF